MIEVTVTSDVAPPPEEVFAFLSDWANNPRWQRGMRSCTWTSDPPMRVGSTYDQEASFLGRSIRSSFEVVEYEPGRRVRIKTTKSTMPLDITREVEANPAGGTTITATIRGGPTGLLRVLDPLTERLVRKSVRDDYGRLRALLDRDE